MNMLQKADGLVSLLAQGWPADAGKMEEMIRDFAGKKPYSRDLFGAPSHCRSLWW